MQGKVAVITGSNVGIGLETAVGIATTGATTVLACRNPQKAEAARQKVVERSGNDDVQLVALDLADLAKVKAAADDILSRWDRLDLLVNNAGGIWSERQTTAQGFEQTFGINHVGHFYLTNLLLDRLKASAPSRIVNLSSFAHHFAPTGLDFADLQTSRGYTSMKAYSRSKLANILFTRGLASRLEGTGVDVYAVHPGPVKSDFGMNDDLTGITGLGYKIVRPLQISAAAGAKTSLHVALSPEALGKTGRYWARSRPGHPSRMALSDDQRDRLWEASEKLLADAGFALA